jgi:hypothetical protein
MLRSMTRRPTSLRFASELRNEARPARDVASLAVFAGVFANAVTQFALQAWMTFRFATDVWGLPETLCVSLIFGLDLFAVVFMIFTFLMRTAKWSTRAYFWLIFAAGIGAQVFAAELYGEHANWAVELRVFAALPALFLAASLHGLILWRRHRSATAPSAPVQQSHPEFISCPFCGGDAISRSVLAAHIARRHPVSVKTTPRPAVDQAPRIERPARPVSPPATPPVSSGATPKRSRRGGRKGGVSDASRANAVARVVAGEVTAGEAASALGVSKRSVEMWVKAHRMNSEREAPKDAEWLGEPSTAAFWPAEGEFLQANGHRPDAEVTA